MIQGLNRIIISNSHVENLLNRIKKSPIGYRLAHGAFWAVFGAAISRLIQLAASVVVARLVGKDHYGELGIVQGTVGMFGMFAGFGMGLAATKYIAEFRNKNQNKAGNIISVSFLGSLLASLFFAVLLLLLSPWLAVHSLNNPSLVGLLRISSLLLFLNAMNSTCIGMLSGFEAFKAISNINWISGIFTFPLCVVMTCWWGINGAVIGMIIGGVFNYWLNVTGLRKETARFKIPFRFWPRKPDWGIFWKFNVPSVLSGAILSPTNWICGVMLVNTVNGYSEMGAYSATNQWFAALMFLPTLLGQASLPVMSERISSKNINQIKKILKISMVINLVLVTPLLLLSFISPLIMGLYGKGFSEKWLTLVFTLFTAWVVAILTPIGQLITAIGNFWPLFIMNIAWAIVFIAFSRLWLIHGSEGLAGARLFAYLCHSIWVFVYLFRMKIWKFGKHGI